MPVLRKKFDVSQDRTKGERVELAGETLVVGGYVPRDAEVSFDGDTGERIPLGSIRRVRIVGGFRRLWLFHSATAVSGNIELLTFGADAHPDSVMAPSPSNGTDGQVTTTLMPSLVGGRDVNGLLANLRTDTPHADAKSYHLFQGLLGVVTSYLFNGATFDRARSASAALLSLFTSAGAMLVAAPGDWVAFSAPAAATVAQVQRAAGAAGVRHVLTSISATFATGATAQAAQIQLLIRDGAIGAGATILFAKTIILPANAVWELNLSGLNIVGSAATAIMAEFSAAGVAGSFQSIAITGHDAP